MIRHVGVLLGLVSRSPMPPHVPRCAAVHPVRQAYGMMGWRVGYIAYPEFGSEGLLAPGALGGAQLKVREEHARTDWRS